MIAPASPEPICVKINKAARMIGVGRTKLYEMIATKQLEVVKSGNRRVCRTPGGASRCRRSGIG